MNQISRVGEITFHYDNKPPINCLYLTERQRKEFMKLYDDATSYVITPYEGVGFPVMINTRRKLFAASRKTANLLARMEDWKYLHELKNYKTIAA